MTFRFLSVALLIIGAMLWVATHDGGIAGQLLRLYFAVAQFLAPTVVLIILMMVLRILHRPRDGR